VVAAHRTAHDADATRSQYAGRSLISVAADLAVDVLPVVEATRQAIEAVPGRQLWALVNNAGATASGITELIPPSAFEKVMAVNFQAPVRLTYELLPELKKTAGARVVFVSSITGFLNLPVTAPYNASKHALEAYADTLRVEMRPWDVFVSIIQPCGMRTKLGLSFADGWLRTYRDAPEERRRFYDESWATKTASDGNYYADLVAADPMIAVRDILDAIRAKKPQLRYLSGAAAKWFFKPLSRLPAWLQDRLLEKICYQSLPPALLAERRRRRGSALS